MPYKNKELRKEYQRRTATPYMKEWREKNRERLRQYMREWSKKRKQNKEVAKRDYEVSKRLESTKRNHLIAKEKAKLKIDGMDDKYIVYSMTKRGTIPKELVNKELIEIHKLQLIIKRKLRNHDYASNKQF